MALNIADLEIHSSAFANDQPIPDRHTPKGEDSSPEVSWSGVPAGTRQLVLLCHDPDAPLPHGWTHWVLCGIPPAATGVPEGAGGQFVEGRNDFGNLGWNGPAPPPGNGVHHYYFWLYALDIEVQDTGLTRAQLLERIDGHVLEQARVIATCER